MNLMYLISLVEEVFKNGEIVRERDSEKIRKKQFELNLDVLVQVERVQMNAGPRRLDQRKIS